MSKGAYIGVGNSAKKIKNIYIGVNGVAKKVKKAYIGVNNVAKLWWSSAKKGILNGVASDLPIRYEYSNNHPSSIPAEGNASTNNWLYVDSANYEYKTYWRLMNKSTGTVSEIPVDNSEVSGLSTSDQFYASFGTNGCLNAVTVLGDSIIGGIPGRVGYVGKNSYMWKTRYITKIDNNLTHTYLNANSGVPTMLTDVDSSSSQYGNVEYAYQDGGDAPYVTMCARSDRVLIAYHRVSYILTASMVITAVQYRSDGYSILTSYDSKSSIMLYDGRFKRYTNDMVETTDPQGLNSYRGNYTRPCRCNSSGTAITIVNLGRRQDGAIIRDNGVCTIFAPASPVSSSVLAPCSGVNCSGMLDNIIIDDETFVFIGNMSGHTETGNVGYVVYTDTGVYKNGAEYVPNTGSYSDIGVVNYVISPNVDTVYFMAPTGRDSDHIIKISIE